MAKPRPTPAQRAAAKRAIADILAAESWPADAWPVAVNMTPWSFYRGAQKFWHATISSERVSDILDGLSSIILESDERPPMDKSRVAKRVRAACNHAFALGIRRLEITLAEVSAHEAIAAEIAAARWDGSPAAGAA